mgnify:CR=1 FL=1
MQEPYSLFFGDYKNHDPYSLNLFFKEDAMVFGGKNQRGAPHVAGEHLPTTRIHTRFVELVTRGMYFDVFFYFWATEIVPMKLFRV